MAGEIVLMLGDRDAVLVGDGDFDLPRRPRHANRHPVFVQGVGLVDLNLQRRAPRVAAAVRRGLPGVRGRRDQAGADSSTGEDNPTRWHDEPHWLRFIPQPGRKAYQHGAVAPVAGSGAGTGSRIRFRIRRGRARSARVGRVGGEARSPRRGDRPSDPATGHRSPATGPAALNSDAQPAKNLREAVLHTPCESPRRPAGLGSRAG
jgi:hypothetical protein